VIGPGGFRFLLAWMVIVEHVSRFEIGKVAVMAFFILSGYWVTRVYEERYADGPRGVQVFYVSRFLRIWPLYAMVFLIVLGVSLALSLYVRPDIWVALPLFGVATHGIDIIGVSWSLDIELQFYLILPVIVLLLRQARAGAWQPVLFGMALAWAFGLVLGSHEVETALLYLPLFLGGAVMYMCDLRAGGRLAALSVAAFVLAAFAAAAIPALNPYVIYGSGSSYADKNFALLWGLLLLPFIAFNVRQPSGPRDRHLGNLSYVLYLLHFPMTRVARELLGRDMSDPEKLIFFAAVMGFSLLIYFLIDAPFEVWRHRMLHRVQKSLSFQKAGG